jgi:Flp pilus assembly pilin Flp
MVAFITALVSLSLPEERAGQSYIEYALIMVLVSIAVIAVWTFWPA